MKKLLIIALLMSSTAAFAGHDAEKAARKAKAEAHRDAVQDKHFAHEKAERQRGLSARVTKAQKHLACLQAAQACVNASTDLEVLNRCHTGCD